MGSGDKMGLVTSHAYTVLGVAQYNGQKFVKCRNPWGVERYTGPWSDTKDATKWTDAAKKAMNHTVANDGTFFVPLANFKTLFYNVIVTYYDDWKRSQKDAVWDRKVAATSLKWSISNPVTQRAMIGLTGAQHR